MAFANLVWIAILPKMQQTQDDNAKQHQMTIDCRENVMPTEDFGRLPQKFANGLYQRNDRLHGRISVDNRQILILRSNHFLSILDDIETQNTKTFIK